MITPEHFRRFAGWHPWRFWGLGNTALLPDTSKCNGRLPEYAWQDADTISREEIRDAITIALEKLKTQAGYNMYPMYEQTTLPYARPYNRSNVYAASIGADGRWPALTINSGYIQELGVQELTLIQANVPITFSDLGSDGINDVWATGAIPTTIIDPAQIVVYVSSAYRYDGSGISDRWRIEPIRVDLAGGTATISGSFWMMADPALYQDVNLPANGINITNLANFMATVDIYRRVTNVDGITTDTSQGVLIWESEPWPCGMSWCNCSYGSTSTDPAAMATAIARVGIRDATNGLVIPGSAAYNSTAGTWSGACWGLCRQPDRVIIRSYAGYPLMATPYRQPDAFWLETVMILTAAELTRVPNTCEDFATRKIHHYQVDLARTGGAGNEEYGAITPGALANPLGTRRGQVEAWNRISDRFLPGSIIA
jgi:hypothetical protein